MGLAPAHWAFDPYPFPLLAVVLGLEAVLLTSFVLIRQNAIDRKTQSSRPPDQSAGRGGGDEGSQDARGDRGSSEIARPRSRQQGSLTTYTGRIDRPRPALAGEEGRMSHTTPSAGSRLPGCAGGPSSRQSDWHRRLDGRERSRDGVGRACGRIDVAVLPAEGQEGMPRGSTEHLSWKMLSHLWACEGATE